MLTVLLMTLAYLTLSRADNEVQLIIQDPCWFYEDNDPVLLCTSNSLHWSIYWRRDGELIAIGGSPIGDDKSCYTISSYINSTARQENLRLSSTIVYSSLLHLSEFRCEGESSSSPKVNLEIPDCATCQKCTVAENRTTSGESPSSNKSSKSDYTWIVVCVVVGSVIVVIALICSGFYAKHKQRNRRPPQGKGSSDQQDVVKDGMEKTSQQSSTPDKSELLLSSSSGGGDSEEINEEMEETEAEEFYSMLQFPMHSSSSSCGGSGEEPSTPSEFELQRLSSSGEIHVQREETEPQEQFFSMDQSDGRYLTDETYVKWKEYEEPEQFYPMGQAGTSPSGSGGSGEQDNNGCIRQ